jgi:uncharacterized protein involved in cysteine biosynthesis
VKNYTPKGIIILLGLVLVIMFFYDNLPLSEQLKSFLPDNKKYASYIIIFTGIIALLIFLGFMYCFTTLIQFVMKYFKNKS